MDVTVIGYGSLMSGQGLSSSGTLQVRRAGIVALADCRRGFAKLSRYGDRFAMDLELVRVPLRGHIVTTATAPDGKVEALALTLSLDDACRLAKREGYDPLVLRRLAETAQVQGRGLAEFLWKLHAETGHEIVAYRRRLFALTGFTSAHYIPHPVSLGSTNYALIFLAPGFEGTGVDGVISVRQQTGIRTIMRTTEAWLRKPTPDQLAYFLVCLLGGVHGICIRDLLPIPQEDPELSAELGRRAAAALKQEVACFQNATGLSHAQYCQAFGGPEAALVRSGLCDFLRNGTGNDT
jgi:hypothetical protein